MLSAIAQLRITFRTGGLKCVRPNDKASRKQYVQDILQPPAPMQAERKQDGKGWMLHFF